MIRTHKHFDDISAEYDESLPAHVQAHYLEKRANLISRVLPAGSVLDVGCGTGRLLDSLPDRYQRVGVDGSVGMLGVMRRRSRLAVAAADAGRLPFADESFDLAISVAVLHHLEDPGLVRRSIQEMWRVVRRGGAVLIWDHNPLNPYWPLLMRRVPQDKGTERLVPLREIRSALAPLGAELTARRLGFTPDFVPRRAMGLVSAIESVLERVPGLREIAAHNVVVARKH